MDALGGVDSHDDFVHEIGIQGTSASSKRQDLAVLDDERRGLGDKGRLVD